MSKDIPIIFSAPMIRALLEGRKTMTRRILKPQPIPFMMGDKPCEVAPFQIEGEPRPRVALDRVITKQKVRYAPGDRLWVRENLCQRQGEFLGIKQNIMQAHYSADGGEVVNEHDFNMLPWWKGDGGLPSIHMPRHASRLTLIVTSVKIERVQDISKEDAKAEGIFRWDCPNECWHHLPKASNTNEDPLFFGYKTPVAAFQNLWTAVNGEEGWDANPFVVAITYRVIKANIDAPEAGIAA